MINPFKKISKKTVLIASVLVILIGVPVLAYFYLNQESEDTSAWYDSNWLYKRGITVGNPGSTLTNEDVLITLDTASLISSSKLQSDYDDLRFIDSDDSTSLTYWIEGGFNASTTRIWVRIPTLPNGGKTIYMYYGNSTVSIDTEASWSGNFILLSDTTCTNGWTRNANFDSKFLYGSTSYGSTSGISSHNHGGSVSITTGGPSTTVPPRDPGAGGSYGASSTHTHTVSIPVTSKSVVPPYLTMIFCEKSRLETYTNLIALFDTTSLPTGWTRFSALDGRFPYGSSTYGTTGGASTHNHTVSNATTGSNSSTLSLNTGFVNYNVQNISQAHTHTAYPSCPSVSNMPPYWQMVYGEITSSSHNYGNLISMFSSTPPLGWTQFSNLTDRFPYAGSSYGSSEQGAASHRHLISITSSTPSSNRDIDGGSQAVARGNHTHTGSAYTSYNSNIPPYYSALFYQRKSSVTTNIGAEEIYNTQPNAPTSLLINGTANPTEVTSSTAYFSAIFSDPDTLDTGEYYRIEVNTLSDFTGTVMWDSGKTSMTSTANGARSPNISYNGTSFTSGTTYYWRIKFWDNAIMFSESDWSSTSQFTANESPIAPTSLQTEGQTNPTQVGDLTPEFSAVFNDPDSGDTAIYYEIEVNSNSSFTGTVMWDSGKTSMTSTANGARSPDLSYAGTALATNGTTYYWRIKFWDYRDAEGPWSSTAQFTMNNPPNPPTELQVEEAINPASVYDTRPEFRAKFQDPDTGDTGIYYEIEVNTNATFTGTIMWDTGQVSMPGTAIGAYNNPQIEYGATNPLVLDGTTYYWRIRFTDSHGTTGSWSSTAQFTMNTPPTAPTSLLTEGVSNPNKIYDTTPEFSAIFNDPNGSDTGASYQIEVNTLSDFTGTVMWDSGKTSMTSTANGARSPDISYAGTTLTQNGEIYYWRIKFWDNYDTEGPWSSSASFRMSGAPNAPTNLLIDGRSNPAGVSSATPSFTAVHSDINGDSAIYYEIEVNSSSDFLGGVQWDSGKQAMTTTPNNTVSPEIVYEGNPLTNGQATLYWRIRFWDTDDNVSPWSSTASFVDFFNFTLMNGVGLEGLGIF